MTDQLPHQGGAIGPCGTVPLFTCTILRIASDYIISLRLDVSNMRWVTRYLILDTSYAVLFHPLLSLRQHGTSRFLLLFVFRSASENEQQKEDKAPLCIDHI